MKKTPISTAEQHYLKEKIRQTLATNPNLGILDVRVHIEGKKIFLWGEVSSLEKGERAAAFVHALFPEYEIVNELAPPILTEEPLPEGPYIRIASSSDLHYDRLSAGKMRTSFSNLTGQADLLLLAGDLTDTGQVEEAGLLADDLRGLEIPTVAVLGNHDYHGNQVKEITDLLQKAKVTVLEGESIVIQCRGISVGIVGTKGFGGGFEGACGTAFGEPEMKAFITHTEILAERLKRSLQALQTNQKIALLHYSPVPDTLAGERLEIFPFLGSYLLAEAVDEGGADLVIHGHAHHGQERGMTPCGVPVRNVAVPLLKKPYALFTLKPRVKKARL
jgi:Icc-related predicted phosphoesterase